MNTQQLKMKSAPVLPISCLIMGGTQLSRHYYVKGGIFFAIQVCFLLYLSDIVHTLIGLFTLGDVAQIRKGLTVIQGDNSIFMLVEGVIATIIVGLFATIYILNIKDARNSSYCHLTFKQQLYKLYEDKFAFIVLTPAFLASIAFIVLPIVITVLVSFTNYAAPNHIPPKNLVDWVGIKNFIMLFKFKIWSDTFLGVALWTFI
ncbi:sugar ABC transporter permease, partial [Escherichia coli]